MSDNIDQAVHKLEHSENISNLVNHGMSPQEKMDFFRSICKGTADDQHMVNSKFGSLEVTCSEQVLSVHGKLRSLKDIHDTKTGADLYDTPQEQAIKEATDPAVRAQRARQSIQASREWAAAPTSAQTERQKNIADCVASDGPRALKSVSKAVCEATQ